MSISTRFINVAALALLGACSSNPAPQTEPSVDPRVGLKAGLMDAGEAVSNMKVVAKAVSPEGFLGITNSDLAFTGNYAIQGNYNGPVIWDISNRPRRCWSRRTPALLRRTTFRSSGT